MDAQSILRKLSYTTASIVMLMGGVFLTGFFLPSYIPDNFRMIMGVVMIIYGIYRVTMLRVKEKQDQERSDE